MSKAVASFVHSLEERGMSVWNKASEMQSRFLHFCGITKRVMELTDLLRENLILFLEVSSRNEALDALIRRLDDEGLLPQRDAFRAAIDHREELVSTGIGSGVAIPHARMAGYEGFFLALGIQKQAGLEWGALDRVPVRLIFLIGGPEDRQADYLHILSMLTQILKDPEFRRKLLQTTRVTEVLKLFGVGA